MKKWQRIENLIQKDKYKEARQLLYHELRKNPDDHWYLTRLSSTFYEQRQYKKALTIGKKAQALAPNCPLVLWDVAGALDMLEKKEEAITLWKKLLRRGIRNVAYGPCGEGLTWARSLLADCRYRIGKAYKSQRNVQMAKRYYRNYLKGREEGTKSIYNLRTVKKEFAIL